MLSSAAALASHIFNASQAGKRDSKIEFSVGEHRESEKIPNHAVERSRLGYHFFYASQAGKRDSEHDF
jgi:hypothetical protein